MHTIYADAAPPGWTDETLGSVVVTKRGCSWSKEQERSSPGEGTIPVIRIPNIQKDLDLDDLLYLDGISTEQRTASAVSQGWTLMVGSNGNPKRIGDSVLMRKDREMVFASFIFALRPRQDRRKITDEFLSCWLQTHRVHEFISETSQMTTGLANMSWSACKKLPVRHPTDAAEQARVAETLKVADDQIRALEEETRKAVRLKRALLQSLLVSGIPTRRHELVEGNGVTYPRRWCLTQLGKLLTHSEYGISAPFGEKGQYQILRMENVTDGDVNTDSPVYIDLPENDYRNYRVLEGDILFNRTNSWELVGRVGIAHEDLDAVFASYLVRLRTNPEKVSPFFLNYALNSPSVKRRYRRFVTPAVSQANINVRNLRQTWLAVPDHDASQEQEEIVEVLDAAERNIAALQHTLTAARRLKQSLIQNLLTGRIRLEP